MKDIYIIYGPSGSGKSTQAHLLAQSLDLVHISWGKLYRNLSSQLTDGISRATIDNEVDDTKRSLLISKIIAEHIQKVLIEQKEKKGIVLEGYPRRSAEVQELLKILKEHQLHIKAVMKINSALPYIIERIQARVSCPQCGENYDASHTPRHEGVCDNDGATLQKDEFNKEQISEDFHKYLDEVESAYRELQSHAEAFFNVSDTQDVLITFSNIIVKLRDRIRETSKHYTRRASAMLPTTYGTFNIIAYQSKVDYSYHIAMVMGDIKRKSAVLTRVHSSCITGDILGSLKCDCGDQLHTAMQRIAEKGEGLLLYLFQEGRGINIINKVMAYDLQDKGLDTVDANEHLGLPAEMRQYDVVRSIIDDLEVESIVLLTNNPDKIHKLTDLGVVIEGTENLEIVPSTHNLHYLSTKKDRMGHQLSEV